MRRHQIRQSPVMRRDSLELFNVLLSFLCFVTRQRHSVTVLASSSPSSLSFRDVTKEEASHLGPNLVASSSRFSAADNCHLCHSVSLSVNVTHVTHDEESFFTHVIAAQPSLTRHHHRGSQLITHVTTRERGRRARLKSGSKLAPERHSPTHFFSPLAMGIGTHAGPSVLMSHPGSIAMAV